MSMLTRNYFNLNAALSRRTDEIQLQSATEQAFSNATDIPPVNFVNIHFYIFSLSQYAERTLNEIRNTFNRTFAGRKTKHQGFSKEGFRIYFLNSRCTAMESTSYSSLSNKRAGWNDCASIKFCPSFSNFETSNICSGGLSHF